MTLSEKIIEIAEERNATFSELARIAGLDPTIISRMVNCKRVGNKTISKLVKAFGKDFEELYKLDVKLYVSGDYTKFPEDVVKNIEESLEKTKNNVWFRLCSKHIDKS